MSRTKMKMAIVASAAAILAVVTIALIFKKSPKENPLKENSSSPVLSPEDVFLAGLMPNRPTEGFRTAPPALFVRPTHFPQTRPVSVYQFGNVAYAVGRNVSFAWLKTAAYEVQPTRMVFLDERPTNNFDVMVTLPDCPIEVFQSEIEKSIGWTGRREIHATDILMLRVKTVGAPGLIPSMVTNENMPRWEKGPGVFHTTNASFSDLTKFLEREIFRQPVIDQTGLTNKYDITLDWKAVSHPPENPDSVKTALLEQLGLELVLGRGRMEMLVVERIKNPQDVKGSAARDEATFAGKFFRAPGEIILNQRGKPITFTISTAAEVGGQLSLTFGRVFPERPATLSRELFKHIKPNAWFAFVESPSRVWAFDGKENLSVLLMAETDWTFAEADDPSIRIDLNLKPCPEEVRQALPEAVRKKYFNQEREQAVQ